VLSSSVAEMGDRLPTIDMGRKVGVLCPFLGGAGWVRQVASWSIQPFGHNTPTSQTDRQTGHDRIDMTTVRWHRTNRWCLFKYDVRAVRIISLLTFCLVFGE